MNGSCVVSVTRARVSVVGQPWHWRSGLGFADAELWYPCARSMSRRLRGRPLPTLALSLRYVVTSISDDSERVEVQQDGILN